MSDELKKWLAVGGLIAVFATITLVRTRAALRGVASNRTNEEWMKLLEVETLEPTLGSARTSQRSMITDPPSSPHLHLARLKLAGADESTEREMMKEGRVFFPIARKLDELGSNAFTFDDIEGPPNDEGRMKQVVDAWLLYSPPLPEPYASRLGDVVCLLNEVSPGSDAQRLGLQQGDVIAELDHLEVSAGGRGYPCAGVSRLSLVAPGRTVAFTILRDGKVVELSGTKPNGNFGFFYGPAPVISPEQLAKH